MGFGGMAGSDNVGTDWATTYDAIAADALSAGLCTTIAARQIAELLHATGANYAEADQCSAPGFVMTDFPPAPPVEDDIPENSSGLPSAAGGDTDEPWGWDLISGIVGYAWPNGHQDQLRSAAVAWRSAESGIRQTPPLIDAAISLVQAQRTPEVDAAVSECSTLRQNSVDVADSFAATARACDDYAQHLDDAHHEIIEMLKDLVIETAAMAAAGAALSWLGGLSLGASAAGISARIAVVAARVASVISKLRAAVKIVTTALEASRVGQVAVKALASMKALLVRVGATKINPHDVAKADVRKFSEYVLDPSKSKGKSEIFASFGYTKADADQLMEHYIAKANEAFLAGKFELGTIDQHGQRLSIPIELVGQNSAAGKSAMIETGWILLKDGTIKLTTPFTGWVK